MTDLNKFVEDAIKTESKVESIKVNEVLLAQTLIILVQAGNVLDQIKKHAFYDKPYDIDGLISRAALMNDAVVKLNNVNLNTITDDETELKINPRIFHSIVGIATESTELLEALDINGENMDNINIAEEFGDIDWYKAIGCDELGIEWVTILDTVIDKLKTRYPNAFTSEDAINRDLTKERTVLETMKTSVN